MNVLRWVKPSATYIAIVFGVGFALGPICVVWLEPRLGVRTAELIEAPFMLLAVILAGRLVGRRLCAGYSHAARPGFLYAYDSRTEHHWKRIAETC
ncbi:MAG: hypothetical protein RMM98_09600 [Acidobacteriota bacterium]|nr:hypothetical protein [Blastocatellia bacterium]MDW8239857.1 hypothetical protein [Acidobacteriota bacterium]